MAVVQDRDKACSQCKQIPPLEELIAVEYEVWANLQELKAGVRDGCPLCSFIFQKAANNFWLSHFDPSRPISLIWNGGKPFARMKQDVHGILFGNTTRHNAQQVENFSIFVDPDESIASSVTAREIHPNPASQEVFDLIKGWISSCIDSHPCCQSTNDQFVPRFVVEVTESEDHRSSTAAPHLRLIETDQESRKIVRYMALSYVWGVKHQPLQLMRQNLAQFKQSIDYTLLPPTIQDFVLVAQALRIKYIWTDILCIIQNDSQVKKQQILQMKDIFGNSYLTVQASNTHSVHDNFLQPRNPQRPIPLKLFYGHSSHVYLRGYTPLGSAKGSAIRRAWVFEESILPNRVIMYVEDQISFMCRRGMWNEDGKQFNDSSSSPMFFRPPDWRTKSRPRLKKLMLAREPPPDRRLDFLAVWYSGLCNSYTPRLLTDPTDRLSAIGGVVPKIQASVRGRYVAGLWESDMPWALMWMSKRNWMFTDWMKARLCLTRPTNPCAPSWSWASLDGTIDYIFAWRIEDRRESDFLATVCMKSLQVNSLGEIINDGKLKVCGPLLYASVVRLNKLQMREINRKFGLNLRELVLNWSVPQEEVGNGEIVNPYMVPTREQLDDPIAAVNFDMDHDHITCTCVWCLLLSPKSGLLLEHVKNAQTGRTFRRLGIFRTHNLAWPRSINDHIQVEVEII